MTDQTTEPTAAEQAVAEALRVFLVREAAIAADLPADFYAAAAVDIAAAVEGHHHLAAYDEIDADLAELRERHRGRDEAYVGSGIEQARRLVAAKADVLRADLGESEAE